MRLVRVLYVVVRWSNCRKPAQISADIKMPQIDIRACVNVHPAATGTKTFLLRDIKSPYKAINSTAGFGCFNGGFCVMETIQAGWQE